MKKTVKYSKQSRCVPSRTQAPSMRSRRLPGDQSNAVRSGRWLFETKPLDAINRDPSQVRVIRGISLEEAAPARCQRDSLDLETQPLDAIREILVDEQDFQPSRTLSSWSRCSAAAASV